MAREEPTDEPQCCEVCRKTNIPFTRVEVSEDGEHYHWLNVCSDDCLQQVTLRWKQIAEIIHAYEYQPKPRYKILHEE